jgi:hypothetical protein
MHQKPRLKKVEAFVLIEDWEAMLASGKYLDLSYCISDISRVVPWRRRRYLEWCIAVRK